MLKWRFRTPDMAVIRGNYLGMICLVIAAGLFVSGTASVIRGLADQRQVADTKNIGDLPKPQAQPTPGLFMGYALPTAVSAPAAGIVSSLITVGKTADGEIDTPKAPDFDKAAWYRESPAPGQYGTSVIVGHVDSYASGNGASVFYNLSKLRPGDLIDVQRDDKTTAIFKVYATRQYNRKTLPVQEVYGANSSNAELRLITCAGQFDKNADEYTSNAVVFASLLTSKPSS